MTNTIPGIGLCTNSVGTMNEDSPVVVASTVKESVTPSVVDTMVEMEKISSLHDTTVSESFPTLTTPVTTTTGNASGKSLYANITGKPSGKKVNVRTLFTPGGNGINVVISVDSIRAISERFANTAYGFFLGKKVAYPVVANYKWHPNENLLKKDVSTVPVWVKLYGVPVMAFSEDGLIAIATKLGTPLMLDSYTSDMYMQSWGRSSADEKKTVKKPSQASRGVLVGPKMAFKSQKEYRPITKKPNTSSSGNKKKGTSNLGNNEATPSGSSFMNIDDDVEFASNTPIGEKIDKIERQIGEGKLRLLDNDGNPLVSMGIVESDSEVEVVYDDIVNLMIPTSGNDRSDKGYSTNSLLEQWRDSYSDNDDYDPYDDDMYENHDFSEHLLSICDDLDITVHGRKKK
nr:hypothetical protein [Tanacetum cinerariifolium]